MASYTLYISHTTRPNMQCWPWSQSCHPCCLPTQPAPCTPFKTQKQTGENRTALLQTLVESQLAPARTTQISTHQPLSPLLDSKSSAVALFPTQTKRSRVLEGTSQITASTSKLQPTCRTQGPVPGLNRHRMSSIASAQVLTTTMTSGQALSTQRPIGHTCWLFVHVAMGALQPP